MSGDEGDLAGLDARINEIYSTSPPGTDGYKARAGELQELFQRRDGNAPAVGSPIGTMPRHEDGYASAPAEHVEPVEPGTAEAFAEELHALGPEGSAIAHEWGRELGQNAAYLRHAVDYVGRDDPGLVELLNAEFEDEHGRITRLGNNPTMIRMAALFGRLLAHRSGLEIEAMRSSRRSSRQAAKGGGDPMGDLTTQIFEAMGRGDRIGAARLDKQRAALARRLYGHEPVDGRL